jgi:hypothetical protein
LYPKGREGSSEHPYTIEDCSCARAYAREIILDSAAGVTQILTDDGDFCTVPGAFFTANQRALAAARTQGRLITR